MTTSKDVFAKRKAGQLDEAYHMALERMKAPDRDEWDGKAFGWCLIDLIKRDAKSGSQNNLDHYRQQLEAIDVSKSDEVLTKQREFAISLCSLEGQYANQAWQLSKAGKHQEAAAIYRELINKAPSSRDFQTSLGWELYRISKALLGNDNNSLMSIKQILNEYLKLNIEKPSLLHSVILQVASKFAGQAQFNMIVFSRIWGLEHLQPDDWERFITDEQKELPSLAERVIQQASKEAAKSNDHNSLNYILPYLNEAVSLYPDNIWLYLNKAKVLLAMGKNDDALNFALEVTKAKVNEYWTWELLGDISKVSDKNLSLSCYCMALICSTDDRFSVKVRLKLASLLIESDQLPPAKYEINRALETKQKEGNKIPSEIDNYISQPWYTETLLPDSNREFYLNHKLAAEELLFSEFSWVAANLGEIFSIPGKENKPKRKLYLQTDSYPTEVVIPQSKFSLEDVSIGGAIKVKGEWDSHNHFQVFLISKRESNDVWDIFSEHVGVVDNVNNKKKLIHFTLDTSVDGVIPFSDLDATFSEGDALSVKLSKYWVRDEIRYRVISARKSNLEAPQSLRKEFFESIKVSDSGLGFTNSKIFIPPNLIREWKVTDGDVVEGVALLTFNKKRSEWGWKAISINLSDK